jgi:hypothetical protein
MGINVHNLLKDVRHFRLCFIPSPYLSPRKRFTKNIPQGSLLEIQENPQGAHRREIHQLLDNTHGPGNSVGKNPGF